MIKFSVQLQSILYDNVTYHHIIPFTKEKSATNYINNIQMFSAVAIMSENDGWDIVSLARVASVFLNPGACHY